MEITLKMGLLQLWWVKCGELPARAGKPGVNECKPVEKLQEPRLFFAKLCEPNLPRFT